MWLLPFQKTQTSALSEKQEDDEVRTGHDFDSSVLTKLNSKERSNAFKYQRRVTASPIVGLREHSLSRQPKKRMAKWIRRVFPKKLSTEHENTAGGETFSGEGSRTPTTCDTSTTGDSTSQDCRNDTDAQSDIILSLQSVRGSKPLLLAYSSEEEDGEEIVDIVDDPEDTTSGCASISWIHDEHNSELESNEDDVEINVSCGYEKVNEDTGTDEDFCDGFRPTFDRSEIIKALFPNGHPDDKREKKHEAPSKTLSAERIAALRRFIRERKNAYNISSMVLRVQSELESVESPVPEPSTIDSSVTTSPSVDADAQESFVSRKGRKASKMAEFSQIVGMLITWDPTWEMLEPCQNLAATTKSRLKKLQDADLNDVYLLGKSPDELSSVESEVVVDEAIDGFQDSSNTFILGFHFDPQRYPETCADEDEIVFIEDTENVTSSSCNSVYRASSAIADDGTIASSTLCSLSCDTSSDCDARIAPLRCSNHANYLSVDVCPDSNTNEMSLSLPYAFPLPKSDASIWVDKRSPSPCSYYFDDGSRSSCDSMPL
jgi:hypothetical protein